MWRVQAMMVRDELQKMGFIGTVPDKVRSYLFLLLLGITILHISVACHQSFEVKTDLQTGETIENQCFIPQQTISYIIVSYTLMTNLECLMQKS